jgi:molecular chaperone GrpE
MTMASDNHEDSNSAEDVPSAGEAAEGERQAAGAATDPETALRAEATENWNRYLRAVAEMDNLRKRHARELENARKYGVEKLAAELLPVRDSIEAGLKLAEESDPSAFDATTLIDGERATLRLLDQALDAAGIRQIDPHGEPFDPDRHEAMSMLPSPDMEPGSVMAVIQKGYELNERIVRPARVIVARAPADSSESSGS